MVSFVCDSCQSTLKKAKVASHSYQCYSQSYSCIDCGEAFNTHTVQQHQTCISEAQKYQGKLYRPQGQKKQPQTNQTKPNTTTTTTTTPSPSTCTSTCTSTSNGNTSQTESQSNSKKRSHPTSATDSDSRQKEGERERKREKESEKEKDKEKESPPTSPPTSPLPSKKVALCSVPSAVRDVLGELAVDTSMSWKELRSQVVKRMVEAEAETEQRDGDKGKIAKERKKEISQQIKQALTDKGMEKHVKFQWKQ